MTLRQWITKYPDWEEPVMIELRATKVNPEEWLDTDYCDPFEIIRAALIRANNVEEF